MKKFLDTYQQVSILKIKTEDTYGEALMKGAINGVPILFVIGGAVHVMEKTFKKSKN